jgi:hypothetical protein
VFAAYVIPVSTPTTARYRTRYRRRARFGGQIPATGPLRRPLERHVADGFQFLDQPQNAVALRKRDRGLGAPRVPAGSAGGVARGLDVQRRVAEVPFQRVVRNGQRLDLVERDRPVVPLEQSALVLEFVARPHQPEVVVLRHRRRGPDDPREQGDAEEDDGAGENERDTGGSPQIRRDDRRPDR